MEIVSPTQQQPATPVDEPGFRNFFRSWFRGRRGMILGGLAVALAGTALSWHWLIAIGIAPLIVSLAPCAAMCALGLCMAARTAAPGPKPGSAEPPKSPGVDVSVDHPGE